MNETRAFAKQIFLDAVENHDPCEWDDFVRGACGSNRTARAEVQDLLRSHTRAADFLDSGAVVFPTDVASSLEKAGDVIGRYTLLEEIGEGGFGVVFMAEQHEPVRRKVALKILKPGMDTRQIVARFEAERQALAMMQHPNIANVLDGGVSDSGRPYFVMELVRGTPITTFCDEARLSLDERLKLFSSICQAVQHAHQKGIIHRDIKPNNVLVTLKSGAPLVKVIDFGIAKAIDQQLTDKTLFTGYAQIVGTPVYMSPEQAQLSSQDVDTRSDIYSLGVLAYELMTGTTPIAHERFRDAPVGNVHSLIHEYERARPSHRVTTLGPQMATVVSNRSTDSRRLTSFLKGDLDWIVLKSIDADPDRRYRNVTDLERDIQRFQNHEPIEARPPSRIYTTRQWIRRNWHRVSIGCLLGVATLLLIIGSWQWYRAGTYEVQLRQIAELQANASRQWSDSRFADAEVTYRKLRTLQASAFGLDDATTLQSQFNVAACLNEQGRLDDAIELCEQVLAGQLKKFGGNHSDTVRTAILLRRLCGRQSWHLSDPASKKPGDLQNALRLAERAREAGQIVFAERFLYDEMEDWTSWWNIAWCEAVVGDIDAARRAIRRSYASYEKSAPFHWFVRSMIHAREGDDELAAACLRVAVDRNAHCLLVPSDNPALQLYQSLPVRTTSFLESQSVALSETPHGLREAYDSLIALHPTEPDLCFGRGLCYAREERWPEAIEDFERAKSLSLDVHTPWKYQEAVLVALWKDGDVNRLTAECAHAIRVYRGTHHVGQLIRVLALMPDGTIDRTVFSELLDDDVSDPLAVGLACFRLGRFEMTIDLMSRPSRSEWEPLAGLFRAMAQQSLGQKSAARQSFRQARAQVEESVPEPVGPPLAADLPERPILWAIYQSVLHESQLQLQLQDPGA